MQKKVRTTKSVIKQETILFKGEQHKKMKIS